MTESLRTFLFWAPRSLTILFILFLALFALDVFDEGYNFWETVVALVMHLIPNLILALVLVLAWRWEWIGGVLFAALGIFYIVWVWGRFPLVAYLSISGPLFVVAFLFWLGWLYRAEIRI
jgi:hypothetical protein